VYALCDIEKNGCVSLKQNADDAKVHSFVFISSCKQAGKEKRVIPPLPCHRPMSLVCHQHGH